MVSEYLGVIKKYAEFSGRAGRREFWMFFLCNFIISIVFAILGRIPGIGMLFGVISGLYGLAILIPNLAVGARRLHDTNRSGLLQLLLLIPLVGFIILVIFWAQPGNPGGNQYGQPVA